MHIIPIVDSAEARFKNVLNAVVLSPQDTGRKSDGVLSYASDHRAYSKDEDNMPIIWAYFSGELLLLHQLPYPVLGEWLSAA